MTGNSNTDWNQHTGWPMPSHTSSRQPEGPSGTNEMPVLDVAGPFTNPERDVHTPDGFVKMPCGHKYLRTFVQALLDDPVQGRQRDASEDLASAPRPDATASSQSLRAWASAVASAARVTESVDAPPTANASDTTTVKSRAEAAPRLRSMLVIVCPAVIALSLMSGTVAMLLLL